MAGVVFQDDFEVAQINPEGAKFEKVNRLVCKGVVYEIEFLTVSYTHLRAHET